MKIFVISLQRANERREHIKTQLNKQFLNFEFFDAVDGNNNSYYWNKFYFNWLRLLCYAKPLTKSQIGCFASHYELWQKCVDLDEPIIVLEDDIEILDGFAEKVKFLDDKIIKYNYIRLMGYFYRDSIEIESGINLYKNPPSGAQGYAISPSAAKLLISYANQWLQPVDDYMDKYWIHGVLPYVTSPASIQCKEVFVTSINDKLKPLFLLKISREICKFYNLLRKTIFNLFN